jgi:nucleoside-diphosphate-sugar epimerase
MCGVLINNKVLLSGSNGFIGSALKSKLIKKGYKVYDLEYRLLNYEKIRNHVKRLKPDYVIHLAAVTNPSYYYEYPLETIQTNFLATVNLAEACKELRNLKQFVYSSSVAVYGNVATQKLDETTPIQPLSTHGIAKASSELYLQYLGAAYDMSYTILRLPNVYGRANNFNYFVEKTISQMLEGDTVKLGNADAIRDWLYIDDATEAFASVLGNKNALKQTFLIGTGHGYSTRETAKLIAKLTGFKGKIEWNSSPPRPTDIKKIICDSSKSKRRLNWAPKYGLEKGIKKTIESIKGNNRR